VLVFGARTTSLFAPNGSGKTPLVQAIAFCLGYPVTFRDDINNRCDAAELVVCFSEDDTVSIRRSIGKDFYVAVTSQSGATREFFGESDFSKAMFQTFQMRVPVLVTTSKEATTPYLSTLLPLFYLKQDGGYSEAYRAPRERGFILDQHVEMVRFVFGLSPKHSFEVKKDLLAAKQKLNFVNRKIVRQQQLIANLEAETDDSADAQELLARHIGEWQRQLFRLQETVSAKDTAGSILQEILATKNDAIRVAHRQADELKERINGIRSIRNEIEGEIETLSLNEEAKRVFESFSEICANPGCGMFIGSSESYAKNLLYLKDQLKDLQRNADMASIRLAVITEQIEHGEKECAQLLSDLAQPGDERGVEQLVSAIQKVTLSLFEGQQRSSAISILSNERTKYFKLEVERNDIQDRIANLTEAGRSDVKFNKLRHALRSLIVKWLDILKTQNVARDIEIDLDFKFKFGPEPLDALTGSTRIRAVLAIRAALFELYIEDEKRPFRFMIFDTPKQHEMHTKDLADYLTAVGAMCEAQNAQLIFSSTEYRHPIDVQDKEWLASFPGHQQEMYLGIPSS
jgi:CII-binding regulator of phage lambda lysogenization HflD